MRGRALYALATVPWAMEEDAFDRLCLIAARAYEPTAADLEVLERAAGKWHDNSEGALTVRDGVGTLAIDGPIFRRADAFSRISGATDLGTLARDFATALDDPEVHSVVLEIDSPGGEAAGVQEFAAMIRAARGAKPIVAYVDSMAASGAYWIASAADRIVANRAAFVGSIGVVSTYKVTKRMQERLGIDSGEIVSANAPRKRPDPTTEKGRAQVQKVVDDLEAVFVDDVAAGRGVTREKVLADFGRGGLLIAGDAASAGMVDAIGDYEPTVAALRADHDRKVEDEQQRRRREGGFFMAADNTNAGAPTPDAAELQRRLEAAEKRAAAAEGRAAHAATQAEASHRRGLEREAAAVYMDLVRPDAKGHAVMVPAQKEMFVSLYTHLGMIDYNLPQTRDEKPVSLAADLQRLLGSGPRHALLRPAPDGSHVDKSARADVEKALAAAGFRVMGDDGEPPADPNNPDASEEDRDYIRRTFGNRKNGRGA